MESCDYNKLSQIPFFLSPIMSTLPSRPSRDSKSAPLKNSLCFCLEKHKRICADKASSSGNPEFPVWAAHHPLCMMVSSSLGSSGLRWSKHLVLLGFCVSPLLHCPPKFQGLFIPLILKRSRSIQAGCEQVFFLPWIIARRSNLLVNTLD